METGSNTEVVPQSAAGTGEPTGCPGFRRWSQARPRPLAAAAWLLSDTASCRAWAEAVLVQFIWFRTPKLQMENRSCRGSFKAEKTTVALSQQYTDPSHKVLKQIPLGDLRPDETVRATQEAQLLSQLHHPAILTFYHSFLERDSFCIITEFCQDRDLDCKLEEVRRAGRSLPEIQVIDWLIQLLLGLHYMHERRILHRDLKAKNIFLKQNLVKIGDFGVSCLLMGSCDLATTFTGTPYYMSPEVLNHQGYDSKSDIWALGCLLHEMCSLTHAFQGPNFLSVVMKIVEGETPTLPSSYSEDLNSVMQRMLQKQPASRPSGAELLKTTFMEENMKKMKDRFVFVSSGGDEDARVIAKNMQTKVHLQTLMERSEVDKMTPRERMRLRKLEAADEKAKRLRKLAEEKYEEIHSRRRELRSRHFEKVSLDVLNESREDGACQPISIQDHRSPGGSQPILKQHEGEMSELHDIPEDPQAAEAYYNQDGFDSYSEDEETTTPAETLYLSDPQVSDLEAMMKHMQKVLEEELSGDPAEPEDIQSPPGPPMINSSLLETRIQHLREDVNSTEAGGASAAEYVCAVPVSKVWQQYNIVIKLLMQHKRGFISSILTIQLTLPLSLHNISLLLSFFFWFERNQLRLELCLSVSNCESLI
ncbi:serine/threonine-protein kinase Nek11 isoform X2 [Sebastes umbrosus]|uniref:serine/threonine-protein kinase Nek11 isoform X2 n=1 Tax=Sebastes umbrosus TaxID=72105 RepID=UPI0018A0A44A|nr:serine/threonine-protein kinase Nek11 isoform X2 [Sebastes umbrosus]